MTRQIVTAVTFLLLCFAVLAEPVHHGKVVHITDGDTLKILIKGRMLKIRLAEIDTPERKQPFGTKAKQALARMAFNKQARVVEVASEGTQDWLPTPNLKGGMVDKGVSSVTLKATTTALKFFFETTLDRADAISKMSTVPVPRRLPVVLSRQVEARLIDAAGSLKYKAALSVA